MTFLLSCASSEKSEPSLRDRYILNSVDEQLPPNLWSPRRRTSVAYYRYLVGDISLMRGEIDTATENYNASYALKPNSFTGAKLVTAHAISGNKMDSLSESRKMVLLYPKSSRLRVLYGDVLYSNGELKKAAKEFEKAVKLDPTNEKAYTSVISVYANLKKFKKALKYALQYKNNLGSSANAWLSEAKIKLNLKDYKGALASIKVAYDMQSSNSNVLMVYAFCLEKNKKSKSAIKYYEKLFRLAPNSLEIAGKLVSLYQEIGGLEEAFDVLDGISNRLTKTIVAVELQKIFILWELKKIDQAVALSNELLQEFPNKDQVIYISGYSLLLAKKDQEALERFKAVPHKSIFRSNAIIYASDILRKSEKINEATSLVEEIKQLEEIKPAVVSYASDFYVKLKSYKSAISFLEFGYELFPKNYYFLFMTGVYYEKIGNLNQAISVMKKLIDLNPEHAGGLNFLGYVYAENGQNLKEAKGYLERAIKLEPKNGYYLDSLGWIYFKLEDYVNAEKYLLEAAKYQPNEGVIFEHLAEVELKKGNPKKSLEYFKDALEKRLDSRDKERIFKRYQEIKSDIS
jgi:tetratricopeptide (TPR) repeat protein